MSQQTTTIAPAAVTSTATISSVGAIDVAALDAALEQEFFGTYEHHTPAQRARLEDEFAALLPGYAALLGMPGTPAARAA